MHLDVNTPVVALLGAILLMVAGHTSDGIVLLVMSGAVGGAGARVKRVTGADHSKSPED